MSYSKYARGGQHRRNCDICGEEFSGFSLWRIVKDDEFGEGAADKAVCVNCALDTVYDADDAGLIEWLETSV